MAGTAKSVSDSRAMVTPHIQSAENNMESFASAAGLMQLSTAAVAADATDSSSNNNSNSSTFAVSSAADASLPPGWQRIIHGSGLPCYVHDVLGVVCWTRPYLLCVEGDGALHLSQMELHRLVQQHVPPLNIFAPASNAVQWRKESFGGTVETASSLLPPQTSQEPNSDHSKRRKLDNVINRRPTSEKNGKQQSMNLEEFKTLAIGDPRVLQACMELSIKTPAQVLQEYQNKNRGVAINYNTVEVEGEGVKLFKTIVTAGRTAAEGVASTKKVAKQLGAQKLLALLHERTAQKYHEVAEMYNSSLKGQPTIVKSSTYGPAVPLRNDTVRGGRGNADPRLQRGAPPNRIRRGRRTPSNDEFDGGAGYRDYEVDRRVSAPPHWGGYNQQPMQHLPQQADQWSGDIGMDNAGPERVVEYSTTPATDAPGVYDSEQYYNDGNVGGNAWSGYSNVNHPVPQPNVPGAYSQQFNVAYGEAPLPSRNRSYGYNNYQPRLVDRPNSTPIEKVTAYLRKMSNQ